MSHTSEIIDVDEFDDVPFLPEPVYGASVDALDTNSNIRLENVIVECVVYI